MEFVWVCLQVEMIQWKRETLLQIELSVPAFRVCVNVSQAEFIHKFRMTALVVLIAHETIVIGVCLSPSEVIRSHLASWYIISCLSVAFKAANDYDAIYSKFNIIWCCSILWNTMWFSCANSWFLIPLYLGILVAIYWLKKIK